MIHRTYFQARLADERIYSAEKWTAFLAVADWFVLRGNWVSSAVVAAMPGPVDREFEVLSLWVAPGERRRGIGSALIQRLIEHGRTEGATSLMMQVSGDNHALWRLARRTGFTVNEVRTGRNQSPNTSAHPVKLRVVQSRPSKSTMEPARPKLDHAAKPVPEN